ncbi:MAG: TraR/DksA family transcriptional regulator [Cyclobacteriaceae bacterium]|nr:TraR/DksA family transcriptional regulator [Cyclobacteriaceae bacterium]
MENKEKQGYSSSELIEFEELINQKLEKVRRELNNLKSSLSKDDDSGTDATSAYAKVLEDGADTSEKESMNQLAARQQKFINNLENALIRIKNGTYGICADTGKLIPKDRLRAVPHTMQCIEAKLNRK